jgi:hypothetical protein
MLLGGVILSIDVLFVAMLNAVIQSVIMSTVVAPCVSLYSSSA